MQCSYSLTSCIRLFTAFFHLLAVTLGPVLTCLGFYCIFEQRCEFCFSSLRKKKKQTNYLTRDVETRMSERHFRWRSLLLRSTWALRKSRITPRNWCTAFSFFWFSFEERFWCSRWFGYKVINRQSWCFHFLHGSVVVPNAALSWGSKVTCTVPV